MDDEDGEVGLCGHGAGVAAEPTQCRRFRVALLPLVAMVTSCIWRGFLPRGDLGERAWPPSHHSISSQRNAALVPFLRGYSVIQYPAIVGRAAIMVSK